MPTHSPTLREITVLGGTAKPCGTPTAPTIDPTRAIPKAMAIDWPVPTHSRAASTPIPPVVSMTRLVASSPRSVTMSVAPNLRARALRTGCGSAR
jgi:hypothetical protein